MTRHMLAARISVLVSWVATALLFIPFSPAFPIATLDSAWRYGVNEAIARRLTFGKDFVFSFGPLAPVYTRMYHPETDTGMIGFGFFFAIALIVGFSSIRLKSRPYLLLGLPLILSQILFFDAVFLMIPFLFLVCVTQWTSEKTPGRVADLARIALLGTAVSILPLVKGSFIGPALACGGLAWILIARKSLIVAVVAPIWAIAAIAAAWHWAGQPVFALPEYFLSQSRIISGYVEAMSAKGAMLQVVVFIAATVSIIKTFAAEASARFGRTVAILTLGLILTLFVAFKAGFVRHDIHALIAASTLLFVAYVSLLMFQSQRTVIGLIVSVLVWSYIAFQHMEVSPAADAVRLVAALRESSRGLLFRLSGPEAIHRKFNESLATTRETFGLPSFEGTVDIYPSDVTAILANGQRWAPRPVLQSYSAYTPELLDANRKHLTGTAAPERIYFSIAPIDGHYPSTEDGASWKELISRYQIRSFLGPYAILDRRTIPLPVETGTVILESGDGKLGTPIRIPSSDLPIWSSIDVAPSLLGRVYKALFKLPPVRLTIQYEDGRKAPYRFIPGTARAGFLLSPTVETDADFAAVQRPEMEKYFKGRRPVSLEISTKLWIQRLLWKRRFAIQMSELKVMPDPEIPPAPE